MRYTMMTLLSLGQRLAVACKYSGAQCKHAYPRLTIPRIYSTHTVQQHKVCMVVPLPCRSCAGLGGGCISLRRSSGQAADRKCCTAAVCCPQLARAVRGSGGRTMATHGGAITPRACCSSGQQRAMMPDTGCIVTDRVSGSMLLCSFHPSHVELFLQGGLLRYHWWHRNKVE